ncbi:MAG: PhzF family phenazine biosynthesis protein [Rhodospirillales bacterium]
MSAGRDSRQRPDQPFFLYDAFADQPGQGNPAAILPCDSFPQPAAMRAIAEELNAWSAFLVGRGEQYHLKIFSIPPIVENPLCGHALLASAAHLLAQTDVRQLTLTTEATSVAARQERDGWISIDLPAIPCRPSKVSALPPDLWRWLAGARPEVWQRGSGYPAWLLRYETPAEVAALDPTALAGLEALVLATALDDAGAVCSRLFAPMKSLLEDPAGGTQQALAAPFWAERLGRERLTARVLSARGGRCRLQVAGSRVRIAAPVVWSGEGWLSPRDGRP